MSGIQRLWLWLSSLGKALLVGAVLVGAAFCMVGILYSHMRERGASWLGGLLAVVLGTGLGAVALIVLAVFAAWKIMANTVRALARVGRVERAIRLGIPQLALEDMKSLLMTPRRQLNQRINRCVKECFFQFVAGTAIEPHAFRKEWYSLENTEEELLAKPSDEVGTDAWRVAYNTTVELRRAMLQDLEETLKPRQG